MRIRYGRGVLAVVVAVATPAAMAQDGYGLHGNGVGGYGLHGNGPVVIVAPGAAPGLPGYGYGTGVAPYGSQSGVVVTPRGAVPYGRYNKDAARDALRINNALGGARAADEAAARAQAPLTPLNPMPGNLR